MENQPFSVYAGRLSAVLAQQDWCIVEDFAQLLFDTWKNKRQVFLCGNGGSAANAMHLANDLLYGIAGESGIGMKAEALTSNSSVLTCLANDTAYSEIFSKQLLVKAEADDVLVVLSGSGNSPNVIRALEVGKDLGLRTVAVVGYSGGQCLELAELSIHFPINDMQLSEDTQLIVGHMCMQWLKNIGKPVIK